MRFKLFTVVKIQIVFFWVMLLPYFYYSFNYYGTVSYGLIFVLNFM